MPSPALAGLVGALFLGVLQGLTEFLPVSSSGHLVLFQQFLEIGDDHVLFDLVLHLGTLLPVLWFYRADIGRLLLDPFTGDGPLASRHGVRTWALLVTASLPTAAIGLVFEDTFEALFSRPAALTVTFAVTGALLFLSGRLERESKQALSFPIAFVLGIAQGLAITPGISRSGSTIATGLLLGLEREEAARFSFLMSVPAILGATLLRLGDAAEATLHPPQLLVGFLASMVTGYLALVLLVKLVRTGMFPHFAWYCWFAAIVAGALTLFHG